MNAKKAHPRKRHGLSLIELVVSMVVMTIIMAGIGSAIFISRYALPDPERSTTRILVSSRVLNQMMEEIRMAIHVSERADTAITFSVADRDGDGRPEQIRYAWAGTAGDPLTREYNKSSPVTVLYDAKSLKLNYDTEAITETYPGPPVWGSESILSSFTVSVEPGDYQYDTGHWIGQRISLLPAVFTRDSMYWRVTRARVVAKSDAGTDGIMTAQIRKVDADGLPTTTVLAKQQFYESSLMGSYTWATISFPDCLRLTPGEKAALVFKHFFGGGTVAYFRYDKKAGIGMLETSNAGSSWNLRSDQAMEYEIYGQVAQQGPDQTVTRHYLTGVSLEMESQDVLASPLRHATQLLNRPEILTTSWETEFDVNPTTSDENLDGINDWRTHDGLPFVASSLSNGVYSGTQDLISKPNDEFNEVMTLEARLCTTSNTFPLAGMSMCADWSGGTALTLNLYVSRQPDGTQNVLLSDTVGGAMHSLILVERLPGGFFDLRLILDPGVDTVAMFINGTHVATEYYTRESPASPNHYFRLQAGSGTGRFDSLSIRVGGDGS